MALGVPLIEKGKYRGFPSKAPTQQDRFNGLVKVPLHDEYPSTLGFAVVLIFQATQLKEATWLKVAQPEGPETRWVDLQYSSGGPAFLVVAALWCREAIDVKSAFCY